MAMLQGKIAIVTGAASGIGRASAIRFAAEGAAIVLSDRSEGVHATARAIEAAGGRCVARQGDAAEEVEVQALVSAAQEGFGGLDIAYANAGISGGLPGLFDHQVTDWEQILRVNLIGTFLLFKHAGILLVKQGRGGALLATASVAGLRSGAGCPAYSASKAGVINLVQTSAQQFATSGVRVNAICPGLIETGMTQFVFEHARARGSEGKLGQLSPLRRAGQPGEVAEVALFLVSDAASYVTGQAIAVDGGLSSSHPFTRQELGKSAA